VKEMNFHHIEKLKEVWGNCGWAEVVPVKATLFPPPELGPELEKWKEKEERSRKEFYEKVEKYLRENPTVFQELVELGKRSKRC